MPVTHQIGDLVLDLTFRSSAGARRTVDDVQSWLEYELLPELDELLTRYSPGRETLRLGTIDLDCGTLTRGNYKQVIRKRLFDELERIVPPQLLALNPEISFALNSGAAPEDTALQQLLGFLESGQLPWHRLQSDDELHGQLFDRIATHPRLANLLQPALRSGPALRRLVRQFSEARLNKVLANLAPGLLPLAIALQDLFDLGELTRRIGRAARGAIHEAQWTGLLSMGFARESAAPDADVLANLLRNWLAAADAYPDAIAATLVAPVTRSGWTDAGAAHRALRDAVLRLARDAPERVALPGTSGSSPASLPAQAGSTHAQAAAASVSTNRDETPTADPFALPLTSSETQAVSPGMPRDTSDARALDAQARATPARSDASDTVADSTQARRDSGAEPATREDRESAVAGARESVRAATPRETSDSRAEDVSASGESTHVQPEASTPADIERTLREALDDHDIRFLVLHWDSVRQTLPAARLATEISSHMRTADFRRHFVQRAPDFLLLDMLALLQPAAATALKALPGSTAPALWRWLQAMATQRAPVQAVPRRSRTRRDARTSETRTPAAANDTPPSAPQDADVLPAPPMPAQFREELWSALFSGAVVQPNEPWRLDTFVTRLLGAAAPALLTEAATLQLRWLAALAVDAGAHPETGKPHGQAAADAGDVQQPGIAPLQRPPVAAQDGNTQQANVRERRTRHDAPAAREAATSSTNAELKTALAALLPNASHGRSRRAQADAARRARRTRNAILDALLTRKPDDSAPAFSNTELAALALELLEHDGATTDAQRPDVFIALLERAARTRAPRRYFHHVLQLLIEGKARDAAQLIAAAERAAEADTAATTIAVSGTAPTKDTTRDDDASTDADVDSTAQRMPMMAPTTIDDSTAQDAVAAIASRLRTRASTLGAVNADTRGWQRLLQQVLRTEAAIDAGLAEVIEDAIAARANASQEPQRIYRSVLDNLLHGRRPMAGLTPLPVQARNTGPGASAAQTPGAAPALASSPAQNQDAGATLTPALASAPPPEAGTQQPVAERAESATRTDTAAGAQASARVHAVSGAQASARQETRHAANSRATSPGTSEPTGLPQQPTPRADQPAATGAEPVTTERPATGDARHAVDEKWRAPRPQRRSADAPPIDSHESTGPAPEPDAKAEALDTDTSAPLDLDTLSPEALPELCIALATGSMLPARLHGSESGWLVLLQAYTGEVLGQDADIRNDLLAAIQHHAQQAAQRERYYRNVLACLVAQVPLDLEELESADAPLALVEAREYAPTNAFRAAIVKPADASTHTTEPEAANTREAGTHSATPADKTLPRAMENPKAAQPSAEREETKPRDAQLAKRLPVNDEPSRAAQADAAHPETSSPEVTQRDIAPGAAPREITIDARKPAPATETEKTQEAAKAPAARKSGRTQEAPRTNDERVHEATSENANTASPRAGQAGTHASPSPASDPDRERNPWLVTATLLAHDTLSPEERNTLAQVLDAVLAETQLVRLRGWLKLLGDTRLQRGWTAHVPRPQLARLIRHAAASLPDVPQERLQEIESLAAPLGIATELYAAFTSARRRSTTLSAAPIEQGATAGVPPPATSEVTRPRTTHTVQLDDSERDATLSTEDKREQQDTRNSEAKLDSGRTRGTGRQHEAVPEPGTKGKAEAASGRDAELQHEPAAHNETASPRETSTTPENTTPRPSDGTQTRRNTRETETAHSTPHPNIDINAIEALHEAALDLARALAEPNVSGAAQVQLKRITDAILNQRDAGLLREWRKVFTSARLQHGLVRHVPAHVLERLIRQLAPDAWPMLEAASSLVVQALGLLVADARSHAIEQAKWQFLFERAFAAGAPRVDADLLTELAQVLAAAAGLDDSTRLLQLIERRRLALVTRVQQAQASSAQGADTLTFPGQGLEDFAPDAELKSDVHLDNVGLVLVAPFIPRLFSMLNVTANGNFPDHAAAERGVHLLQYIVTGQEYTPEYRLLLNKVMCGIIPGFPVCAGIDVSPQEKDAIEQLLQSIIQHWKILGGTSIAGLRQTFLQREGWLRQDENGWHVEVKPGSFDMLLDQLPWSYSLIKFTWMDKAMHVTWRNKQTQ